MPPIYVWWIGADAADARLLEATRARIGATFEVATMVWDAPDRPSDTWDARRGQHSSTGILRWLVSRRPLEAGKVIAVTDVDLFIPVLTFVYGEAQLGGRAAVVSTARLGWSRTAGACSARVLSRNAFTSWATPLDCYTATRRVV